MSARSAGDGGGERVQKFLARAGIASRRKAEELIEEGRVTINGQVATLGDRADPERDSVKVDGKRVQPLARHRYLLLNKPRAVMSTVDDPEGRPTIYDGLPSDLPRLMPIGRLDMGSEGLLLLTNDGELKRRLELPATGWLRRYRVRVHGRIDEARLGALEDGIAIEGFRYGPIQARLDRVQGSNAWLTVALREGKNREIRRVFSRLGHNVLSLKRTRIGALSLHGLQPGDQVELRVEVTARNPELALKPGVSESRLKAFVTQPQFVDWVIQTLRHESRLRQLEARQRGVFAPEGADR